MPARFTDSPSGARYQSVAWPETFSDDATPFPVPATHSVAVSIHGVGALFGSTDNGETFDVARDTGGKPIMGANIGAVHVQPGYTHLKPGTRCGRCELAIKESGADE